MPLHFDTIFFTIGQNTHRLHFPYMLEGFERSMLTEDEEGKFTSDTREYWIKGYRHGSVIYDVHVMEGGADIAPSRIDAWFAQGGKKADIPLDLLSSIKMRNEEATQNKTQVYLNGKQV